VSLKEYIPSTYKDLLAQPAAVFGLGASGKAASVLLSKLGVASIVYDERAGDEEAVSRTFDRAAAKRHRLVVHSPAFVMDHPWIETALGEGCCVVSEIDFAQQFRRGPTIAVIGTNGKTTLQEFITFCLKRIGTSAVAAGQNAYPLSRLAVHQEMDGVTAVCELGPAYIEPLKEFRFDTLFWTNFHEDHIADKDELKAAFESSRRLMHLSPDARFFLGDSVIEAAGKLGCPLPGKVFSARQEDYPDWDLPDKTAFATSIHRPALALFRRYWLEMGYSDSLLKSAAEHFEVRAHRLHLSTVIGKTGFWNDANAGNFAATEAALKNFPTPVVWVGGGHFRGGDLEALVDQIQGSLKGAVITGNAAWHLLPILEDRKITCRGSLDLKNAVDVAFEMAGGEAPVVFSPGFLPGEDYGDSMERGICFENAVLGLKHQKGSV
jgi:UDP-N-acetylmuramoylalanine--D-glutamate ligase